MSNTNKNTINSVKVFLKRLLNIFYFIEIANTATNVKNSNRKERIYKIRPLASV